MTVKDIDLMLDVPTTSGNKDIPCSTGSDTPTTGI